MRKRAICFVCTHKSSTCRSSNLEILKAVNLKACWHRNDCNILLMLKDEMENSLQHCQHICTHISAHSTEQEGFHMVRNCSPLNSLHQILTLKLQPCRLMSNQLQVMNSKCQQDVWGLGTQFWHPLPREMEEFTWDSLYFFTWVMYRCFVKREKTAKNGQCLSDFNVSKAWSTRLSFNLDTACLMW